MASREKRPLAPSKSKQKANNNNSSLLAGSAAASAENVATRIPGSKKSKNLVPNPRNKQARELLEAIATNSQLPVKVEAALPRKRALQTALKRKQKAKKTLIKVKQKLPIKTLKRITDPKSIVAKKKKKKNKPNKTVSDSSLDSGLESEDAKNKSKTAKKLKASTKTCEEIKVEVEDKRSPKLGKKFKESSPKAAKNNKTLVATQKRQESKEREIKIEPIDIKHIKTEPVNDSYELTIEEVIASSMLVEAGIKVKSEESALAGDLKGKKNAKTAKRSLRNGKLRQSLQKGEKEPRRSVSMSEAGVDGVESLSLPDAIVDVKIEKEEQEPEEEEEEEEQEEGDNVTSDVETNNNAEAGESGPRLRSKTKARSSDSSDEIKSENGDLKKDKMPGKVVDVKAATGVSNNTPKSRRSSLNVDVRRSPMFTGSIDKMTPDGTSLQIDEMIDKIKLSIAKSIESKIIMGQTFEPPKREEITATIHSELIIPNLDKEADDDKSSVSKNRGLGPSLAKKEIKSEDAENSVPRVADTAKEIEKLVMGESEPTNDKEAAEEQPEPQADVADIVSEEKAADVDAKAKESTTSTDSSKDSKQCEETKKSALPSATRKSPRVTAGRSSTASERQRSSSLPETSSELEKTDPEEQKAEQDQKTNDVTDETKTSSKTDESTNANKTDTASEVLTAAVEETEQAMEVDNSVEVNKESESFEDLASSLDKLVEDSGKETSMKVSENDVSSDVEMHLVIDEEESSTADNSQIKDNNKEGCDQKPEEISTPDNAIVPDESKSSKEVAVLKEAKESEVVVEQKETRRSLRTRAGDKLRKSETAKPVRVPTPVVQEKSETKVIKTEDAATSEVPSAVNTQDDKPAINTAGNEVPTNETSETTDIVIKAEPIEQPEPQMRTRRSREAKKPIQSQGPKGKRGAKKQDAKKVEAQQQTKEDSMLDNEVASINESSSSFVAAEESMRGVSASERRKSSASESKNRSKSENDVRSTNISRERSTSEDTNPLVEAQQTKAGSNGISQKDLDEASTSGESSSSVEKIHESPEDRAKKEAILRHLGLESWEKVHERKKKEESGYTGTLKTVIRIAKEGKNYTIQKEGGPSAIGDSTSDDENEDSTLKDRQSLVIPEKSSSFSIHPGRLCADNCCYCHGKFGSLDTPMHLAQMKSDERRKKILENEVHLTKDSCLCDACYRHVDRKANMSPTNMQLKPQRSRHSIMECMVVNCTESARHHVKRRWLLRIKSSLKDQLLIKWDTTQHSTLTMFCGAHYAQIEKFLMCTLCRRRLTRNFTYPVGMKPTVVDDLNKTLRDKGIPATMQANAFFCRLCKYFVGLFLKHSDVENISANNKGFYKNYRKKLLFFFNCPDAESDDEAGSGLSSRNKSKNSGNGTNKKSKKMNMSNIELPNAFKLTDIAQTGSATASDKSSPEPSTSRTKEPIPSTSHDPRPMGIENAIEKLKKRKALSTSISLMSASEELSKNGNTKGVAELLSRDKEVTLTRLPPKRPRIENNTSSNDITPVVQRLGANPSISVRTLFPGEEEMNLHANIEFNNVREVTPQGWEKCATMIQYDRDTKMLWQELQRPYGNQSSFLRHLILLEKYYRAGDLILAPNASRNAINYSTSVQNRLISYEGPEKMEESMEPHNTIELNNSRRLSGGYVLEQRPSAPSTSTSSSLLSVTSQLSKMEPSSRVMKLTPGVSIIKKPPPNLQRLNTSGGQNGSAKRKETVPVQKGSNLTGGKVFQLTEPDFKKLQNLKRQKQIMNERNSSSPNNSSGRSNSSSSNYKSSSAYDAEMQKSQSLFRKHLLMQQEMLNQRSRGDFEPLVCEMRSLSNENTPTQNLINNLNLPKSIQVTTKPPAATSTPIPILPKIPKSLTVIPQTVSRAQDK